MRWKASPSFWRLRGNERSPREKLGEDGNPFSGNPSPPIFADTRKENNGNGLHGGSFTQGSLFSIPDKKPPSRVFRDGGKATICKIRKLLGGVRETPFPKKGSPIKVDSIKLFGMIKACGSIAAHIFSREQPDVLFEHLGEIGGIIKAHRLCGFRHAVDTAAE